MNTNAAYKYAASRFDFFFILFVHWWLLGITDFIIDSNIRGFSHSTTYFATKEIGLTDGIPLYLVKRDKPLKKIKLHVLHQC